MAHIPHRTCIGCYKRFAQSELVAICKSGSELNVYSSDSGVSKSGRCAYLCKNEKCLDKAMNRKPRNGLENALKVPASPNIWEEIKSAIS